ncbi:flagellar hook-associated protein 2 [Bacillus sp. RD4P76]|uniref:Flagellar hook-associated protein 2 n=2 Tax=Bacillus suaedaesalsae TaxID=2810349 RepID=A0ABS2DFJ0_9BACI|nr:flagellar hook-associated protein 2 [Bacillus suaedaesalsae]
MDIDTLVKDLMKAERMPLDKLVQKKQILEWQRDDYRSMNTLLKELDTFTFDGVLRQATFTKKHMTSSNESDVSVKNINSTSNMDTTIKVEQLAKAAYINSSTSIKNSTGTFDPNGKLVDQRANLATDYTSNTFSIQSVQSDGSMGEAVSFTIDPAVDSLNSIISKINQSSAGVNAFFDSQTGKVSLTAKNSGDAKSGTTDLPEIVLSGDFLTGSLNLAADNQLAGANGQVGQDAKVTINGLSTTRSSNTFQINGFEYTLKAASNTDIMISSSTDVNGIFDSIKGFVDKYNEIIGKINAKTSEERYRTYKPLTSEQKESMEDREIELWEERAKSGMLRGDTTLSSGLNKLRMDLYGSVNTGSTFNQLAEIGIKTSPNYLDKGKLIIDEAKLRDAISKDPNAVYNLFSNDGPTQEDKGVARRLRATISTTIKNIEQKAGNSLRTNSQFSIGKLIMSTDSSINAFEDRLIKIEDRYWRQFTAMEKAIQRSNEQSAFLMNSFTGGM